MIDGLNNNAGAVQAASAVVLAATFIAVAYYAYQTRTQAEATERMAEATLRPVILLWTSPTGGDYSTDPHVVYYQNIGNGPAINIVFSIDPDSAGGWPEPPQRVGMGVHEKESRIFLKVNPPLPHELRVVARYEDVMHSVWKTTLRLEKEDSILRNMESKVERVESETK